MPVDQIWGRQTELTGKEATFLLTFIKRRNPLYCHPLNPEGLAKLQDKLEQIKRDAPNQ